MRLFASIALALLLALCQHAGAATTFVVNDAGEAPDAAPGDGSCATSGHTCTLVAAIQEANALSGADVIQLPPGTYVYTATLPTVTSAVTIEPTTGTDPSSTVIQASNTSNPRPRLFDVGTGGDLTLDLLTLENAQTGPGSALQVTSAAATLMNCVVTNNQATAMYVTSNGSLTLSGSTISSNSGTTGPGGMWIDFSDVIVSNTTFSGNTGALGGAAYIYTSSDDSHTDSITDSTFSLNTSTNSGGALLIDSDTVTIDASTFNDNATSHQLYGGGAIFTTALGAGTVITNSAFTGNQANAAGAGNGGAIFVLNRASCTGCTFSQNLATGNGGAVYAGANDGAEFDAVDSTFSDNEAVGGGAISTSNGSGTFKLASVTITKNLATGNHGMMNANEDIGGGGGTNGLDIRARNTIVAGNQSPLGGADCEGQIMSQGYDLVGDDTDCSITASAGNQIGTGGSPIDPGLGALTDNGGPTLTHALLATSPAGDAGDPAGCTDNAGGALATDQRGQPRTVDGNSDGIARCDIGAYEAPFGAFAGPRTSSTTSATSTTSTRPPTTTTTVMTTSTTHPVPATTTTTAESSIDSFAAAGRARPLAQQTTSASAGGLVAAYGFEEGSGTTVADSSGNGNNGTISNATWTTAGKYGKALSFNGTSARIDVPDSASLHLTAGMTLEAWLMPTATSSAWRDAIYKGNDNYYLEATSSTSSRPVEGGTFGGANANVTGTAKLATNTWTYLASTYDGATLRLYVNGTQVATLAKTGAIATSTNPLQIGGDSIYGQFFKGTIDEVRVYNVALTAAQIQADMNTPVNSGAPPDTTPPTQPGTLTATAASSGQINLSWGASTDNVGVTGYQVERCAGASCTTFAQIGTASGTTFSDNGLAPNSTFSYRVRATDAAGNLSPYSNVSTATTLPDTTPPTQPGTLTATASGSAQINLSWGASTDNVGVTSYLVERCQGAGCTTFTQVGTPTATTFSDTGLTAGTSYSYRVRATDAAGNLSPYTNVASATTTVVDTQPPTQPGTLTATAVGNAQVNLAWGAATDNVGVTNYLIERCQGATCSSFAQVATSTTTTFNNTGLTAGTSYSYRVRATDAAGNLGPYTNVATAITSQGPVSGLVAAYAFDEGSGTTVADASGNGNTGTISGATWTAAGKYGSALSFNGTSATVNIPDSAVLHLGSAMTLEAWVDPTTVSSAWRDVIYKANDAYYLEATSENGGIPGGGGTFGGAGATVYGTSAITANVWTHLAVTYDGATLRFYVNGVMVGSQAKTGAMPASTTQLQIGGDSLFGQYFSGSVDEVRIYNTTLAATDIQSDMNTAIPGSGGGPPDTQPPSAPGTMTATAVSSNRIDLSWGDATDNVGVTGYRVDRCQGAGCTNFSHLVQIQPPVTTYSDTTVLPGTSYTYQVRAMDAAGNIGDASNPATAVTPAGATATLVASYSFDEGSGTTVNDSSGHGNNGTVTNTTWTSAGEFGGALVFNGTNSSVGIPNSSSLDLTTGMTLEAWVNPSASPSVWRDIIYKGDDNYYLEGSSTNSAPAGGGTFGGTNGNAFGGGPLPTNTWTHLALTYDGSTLRLYVNGVQVGTQAKTGTISTSTNPLQIGGDSLYGQNFAGKIDEVRIYNGPLTAGQIQADMNSGLAVPSAPSNLTATVAAPTQINLSWGASNDAAGVTGYRVERCQGAGCSNFAEIAQPTGTSYSDTNVLANTSYGYQVRAIDSAGKLGPYSNVATAFTGLLVSPRNVALTPGETQQYTATIPGGGSPTVTWSVDGVNGGNSTVGTVTSGGLYTAPAAAGTHTVTATSATQAGSATAYTSNYSGVLTYHEDNMRTGENTSETVLTPANVNSSSFGKLFSYPLDGQALAQPLYVENLAMGAQGTHNVVFVVSEHNSVYAFDADGRSSTPLWKDSFINPAAGVTTVPAGDTGECCDIAPEIGITSTPVIDRSTNTMYVVAKTKEVSGGTTSYVQRLHALDLTTGAEKFGGPVVIQASVPGTGAGSSGGRVPFDPLHENQRTGLLLLNGVLYFGFSSHGDIQPYHGWILGYNATTLQQTLAFCLTPDQEGAGVWMSGGGIATDSTGSLYYISGDGEFDGTKEWGDSYIKMSTTGTVQDFFTPFNQDALNAGNHDLGSGEALLLPDQPGAHPHEMVSAGKDGTIYLVDRDNMGHYSTTTNNVVETLPNIFPNGNPEPGNFTAPVYLDGYVFFGPLADNLQGFKLTNGLLSTSATLRSAALFPDRGASMTGSANGSSNNILWAVQRNGGSAGVLFAYDPDGSSNGVLSELYDSNQAGSRDTLDVAAKFNPPVIANGHVYVAGVSQLTVYGLLP